MEKAPAFDKDKLPNMEDMNWGEGIFKHYGVSGYDHREQWATMDSVMIAMVVITVTRCIMVQDRENSLQKNL